MKNSIQTKAVLEDGKTSASVVQRIEHRSSEPIVGVRFPPEAVTFLILSHIDHLDRRRSEFPTTVREERVIKTAQITGAINPIAANGSITELYRNDIVMF